VCLLSFCKITNALAFGPVAIVIVGVFDNNNDDVGAAVS